MNPDEIDNTNHREHRREETRKIARTRGRGRSAVTFSRAEYIQPRTLRSNANTKFDINFTGTTSKLNNTPFVRRSSCPAISDDLSELSIDSEASSSLNIPEQSARNNSNLINSEALSTPNISQKNRVDTSKRVSSDPLKSKSKKVQYNPNLSLANKTPRLPPLFQARVPRVILHDLYKETPILHPINNEISKNLSQNNQTIPDQPQLNNSVSRPLNANAAIFIR